MIPAEELLRHAATLHQSGQYAEAEEMYLAILREEPQHPDANHNLGLLAMQHEQAERALPYLQAAWEADPTVGQYWLTLTECLLALGHFEDAQHLVDEAAKRGMNTLQVQQLRLLAKRGLARTPPPSAVAEKALALFRAGRNAELEQQIRPLLEEYPGWVMGWSALGAAMQLQGKEAEHILRYAAQLAPDDAEIQSNLGAFLRKRGRLDEAVECLRTAVKLRPEFAEAFFNLGITLSDLSEFDQAFDALQCALKIKPEYVEALYAMGAALNRTYRFYDALGYFRRALELKPNLWDAYNDMAIALHGLGRTSETMGCYRKLLESNPESAIAYSNLLFCLSHDEDGDAGEIFREHCRYGERFESPLRKEWGGYANTPSPERRLRIGFVSADLYDHAVASFIEPVLAHLSGNPEFTLCAYHNRMQEDAVTQRLKKYFELWRTVAEMSDSDLAQEIRADGIDILIDLSGHTGHNRLLAFARKPAPLQVSWLGYAGTTGLKAVDYYLADRFFLPPGQFDDQFTEKIVQMPACVPFLPFIEAPEINELPALSNHYVTFGSFNRLSKISRSVIALWSQLLRELPTSKMLLGGMPTDGTYGCLLEWFAEEGIGRERLSFHPRSDMSGYLGLHHQVDICLDTFPYNGGTTTFHALWMGVPTLTLTGHTPAGRSGASILGRASLEAFVAHDAADFVQMGLSWAGNLAALSDIRARLRERLAKSAITHPEQAVSGLVRALRIMWRRWCEGLPPESFEVSVDVNNVMQEVGK